MGLLYRPCIQASCTGLLYGPPVRASCAGLLYGPPIRTNVDTPVQKATASPLDSAAVHIGVSLSNVFVPWTEALVHGVYEGLPGCERVTHGRAGWVAWGAVNQY